MHSQLKLTLTTTTSQSPKTNHPKARTPDTDVNRPKRKLWSRRSRTSLHPPWSKVASKLKAKSPREDSRKVRTEVVVVVVEAVAAEVAEVDLATLLTVTRKKEVAQEPKVEKEEAEEVAAEEVTTALLAEKERIRSKIPARPVRDNLSEESPEKMPTLTIADQEPDVAREINKNPEVAVDNGETQSKTSPKLKVKKVKRKKRLKKSLLKKPRLKSQLLNPLRKKNPMYT